MKQLNFTSKDIGRELIQKEKEYLYFYSCKHAIMDDTGKVIAINPYKTYKIRRNKEKK